MLRANKVEEDLIARFIDAAQKILPEVRIKSVEKFEYDNSSYLRIGLDLEKEIDVDSPDFQSIQKIASALPVHPKYNLSMTFTDSVTEDNEVWLSFLEDKYKSPKVNQKTETFLKQLWYRTYGRVYVRRGSMMLVNSLVLIPVLIIFPLFCLFLILYFLEWSPADTYYRAAARTLERRETTLDYERLSPDVQNSQALKNAKSAARNLQTSLAELDKDLESRKDLSPEDVSRRRAHLFYLHQILKLDPFVGKRDFEKSELQ